MHVTAVWLSILLLPVCLCVIGVQYAQYPPGSPNYYNTQNSAPTQANTGPAGARRPPVDTDGALYQKTVGGVTFRIVVMCQDFEILMDKNTMEFDTVQNGCRFVFVWPKHLKVTDSYAYRPPNTAP